MENFKAVPINIKSFQPIHDSVLITADVVEEKSDDIIKTKTISYIKYIQTIVKVGNRVPEELGLKEGMEVKIDTTAITRDQQTLEESVVFLSDPDTEKVKQYFNIPSRHIQGIVESFEVEVKIEQ